ncbi:MAG: hypothetical protein P8100_13230 [bacterium]|jgi:hypothetical protein
MNCKEIDKLVNLALFDADHAERHKVTDHISQCDRCSKLYGNLAAVAAMMDKLKKTTPQLDDSESIALTDSIMEAVTDQVAPAGITHKREGKALSLMIRILAAASVLLIITLSVEQYLIVEKVRTLENNLELPEKRTIAVNNNFSLIPLRAMDLAKTEQRSDLIESVKGHSFRALLLRNRILNQPPVNYGVLSGILAESKDDEIINTLFVLP